MCLSFWFIASCIVSHYQRCLLTLLHGFFSRFLNCTNGTKSRNAPHMIQQNPISSTFHRRCCKSVLRSVSNIYDGTFRSSRPEVFCKQLEKQSITDVLQNSCFEKFRNIHRKTSMLESFLLKFQVFSNAGVFLWILQNFEEYLFYRTASMAAFAMSLCPGPVTMWKRDSAFEFFCEFCEIFQNIF